MNLSFDLICINCFLDTAGNRNLIAEDALVRAAGMGKEDRDDEGADAGCCLLAACCWLLATGYWLLAAGCWFQKTVCGPLVLGGLHVEFGQSKIGKMLNSYKKATYAESESTNHWSQRFMINYRKSRCPVPRIEYPARNE